MIDRTGDRYGKLTVIAQAGRKRGQVLWLCQCSCGESAIVIAQDLSRGHTRSCGCLNGGPQQGAPLGNSRRLTHGHARPGKQSVEYRTWERMKQRCYNPNTKNYRYWGGRGIVVCPQWRDSFMQFLADVGQRPSSDLSLDRIDVNGNYEPGNVRWADRLTQSRNRRNVKAV